LLLTFIRIHREERASMGTFSLLVKQRQPLVKANRRNTKN
jgi:hypothetical protein